MNWHPAASLDQNARIAKRYMVVFDPDCVNSDLLSCYRQLQALGRCPGISDCEITDFHLHDRSPLLHFLKKKVC